MRCGFFFVELLSSRYAEAVTYQTTSASIRSVWRSELYGYEVVIEPAVNSVTGFTVLTLDGNQIGFAGANIPSSPYKVSAFDGYGVNVNSIYSDGLELDLPIDVIQGIPSNVNSTGKRTFAFDIAVNSGSLLGNSSNFTGDTSLPALTAAARLVLSGEDATVNHLNAFLSVTFKNAHDAMEVVVVHLDGELQTETAPVESVTDAVKLAEKVAHFTQAIGELEELEQMKQLLKPAKTKADELLKRQSSHPIDASPRIPIEDSIKQLSFRVDALALRQDDILCRLDQLEQRIGADTGRASREGRRSHSSFRKK